MGFKLLSTDPLTSQIKSLNLNTWEDLMKYIHSLPYGRNANRHDFSLVLKEKKGTCSSKHALLREVAALNDVPNVRLIIGMYKMSEHNTPNIGDGLSKSGLDYIPEAHCYLMIDKKRVDLTTNNSEFLKIEKTF